MFSSRKIVRLIEELPPADRHILMDATFKIVPIGEFKQLLVLYARIKNEVTHFNSTNQNNALYDCTMRFIFIYDLQVFPFAYVLMSRKTEHAVNLDHFTFKLRLSRQLFTFERLKFRQFYV